MANDKPPKDKVKKHDPVAQENWWMAADDPKTVRVIANVNSRAHRTVNVVSTRAAADVQAVKAHKQQAGAPPAHSSNYCETVQAAPATTPGLRTIFIPGYAGPS